MFYSFCVSTTAASGRVSFSHVLLGIYREFSAVSILSTTFVQYNIQQYLVGVLCTGGVGASLSVTPSSLLLLPLPLSEALLSSLS